MNKSKIIKNVVFSVSSRIIYLVLGFVSRKVFIMYLGKDMLGLSSLFSDILNCLNLAELGIGLAIQYNLYQPIADQNESKIIDIINIIRKFYNLISFGLIVMGLLISNNLEFFIKNNTFDKGFLRVAFMLQVLCISSTYFMSHRRLFL